MNGVPRAANADTLASYSALGEAPLHFLEVQRLQGSSKEI